MSTDTQQTYYKKSRDLILSKAKAYYENNKDRISKQRKDKYNKMSEEKKVEMRKHWKNVHDNMIEKGKILKIEYENKRRKNMPEEEKK